MDIEINWAKPLLIAERKKIVFDEVGGYDELEAEPGVYFFSRKHGDSFVPFYIGRTGNLRKRLKDHMNSAKIRDILRGINDLDLTEIRQGARHFHAGYFVPKRGQRWERCTDIVERHMIRWTVEQEYPLINTTYTVTRSHKLTFSGSPKNRGVFEKTATTPDV